MRSALAWLGLPDPQVTLIEAVEEDSEGQAVSLIVTLADQHFPPPATFKLKEFVSKLDARGAGGAEEAELRATLATARAEEKRSEEEETAARARETAAATARAEEKRSEEEETAARARETAAAEAVAGPIPGETARRRRRAAAMPPRMPAAPEVRAAVAAAQAALAAAVEAAAEAHTEQREAVLAAIDFIGARRAKRRRAQAGHLHSRQGAGALGGAARRGGRAHREGCTFRDQ